MISIPTYMSFPSPIVRAAMTEERQYPCTYSFGEKAPYQSRLHHDTPMRCE
jgi:hypothetical protein